MKISTVKKILLITILLPILFFGYVFLALAMPTNILVRPLAIYLSDILGGNSENYLTCEELPSKNDADKAFKDHKDSVEKINKIARNEIAMVSEECPGKADIYILIDGDSQRQEIIKLLGKNFYGIPYRIING